MKGRATNGENMSRRVLRLEASVTETGATTYTNDAKEIPGSAGAKVVVLRSYRLDVAEPTTVANTLTQVKGGMYVGNQESRSSIGGIGSAGCIDHVTETKLSGASIPSFMSSDGPARQSGIAVIVPPSSDGKFYLTLEVIGVACTSAKAVNVSAEFLAEF